MNILRAHRVTKQFGGVLAVNRCSFDVREGSITGLIGPNGAGKTTVFNLIVGYYGLTSGSISFMGNRIDHLPTYRIAQAGIGRTFQLIRLFNSLTALENLLIARKAHRGEMMLPALLGTHTARIDESENIEACRKLLQFVGLSAQGDVKAQNLGYGEQKLLEIARVLALDPRLILLDEPMAGLEMEIKKKLIGLVRELQSRGKTFLIIEHDMGTVMDVCEEIVVLDHGTEIACGTPAQIQRDSRVIEAYLGPKVDYRSMRQGDEAGGE